MEADGGAGQECRRRLCPGPGIRPRMRERVCMSSWIVGNLAEPFCLMTGVNRRGSSRRDTSLVGDKSVGESFTGNMLCDLVFRVRASLRYTDICIYVDTRVCRHYAHLQASANNPRIPSSLLGDEASANSLQHPCPPSVRVLRQTEIFPRALFPVIALHRTPTNRIPHAAEAPSDPIDRITLTFNLPTVFNIHTFFSSLRFLGWGTQVYPGRPPFTLPTTFLLDILSAVLSMTWTHVLRS